MVDEKYDEAIVDMRLAVRNNQQSTRALYLLGTAYRLSGDPILAADTYRQLLKIKPTTRTAFGSWRRFWSRRDS